MRFKKLGPIEDLRKDFFFFFFSCFVGRKSCFWWVVFFLNITFSALEKEVWGQLLPLAKGILIHAFLSFLLNKIKPETKLPTAVDIS